MITGGLWVGVGRDVRVGSQEVEGEGVVRGVNEGSPPVGEEVGLKVERCSGEEDACAVVSEEMEAAEFKLEVGEKETEGVPVLPLEMVGERTETLGVGVRVDTREVVPPTPPPGEFVANKGGGEGVGFKGVTDTSGDADTLGLPLKVSLTKGVAVPGAP